MIRVARLDDLPDIVELAATRRAEYAAYQPKFWRPAPDASARHRRFLASLIGNDSWGCYVAEHEGLAGYLFATLVTPPPVYQPGGPSCFVDDFAVRSPKLWADIGADLLQAARTWGRQRGAGQLVVVNAQRDEPKADLLGMSGLNIASTWWVQPIDG